MKSNLVEELTATELLLLTFIRKGVANTYELTVQAGLSTGVTTGPLRGLVEKKLIKRNQVSRSSTRYSITKCGEEKLLIALQSGKSQHWWLVHSNLLESLPRAVFLSMLTDNPKNLSSCLAHAKEQICTLARQKEREAENIQESISLLHFSSSNDENDCAKGLLLSSMYRWIKTTIDASVLANQADSFGSIISKIEKRPACAPNS